MSTAYDQWVGRNPARRAPEVDFGTIWSTKRDDQTWRVSWNSGSGELVAVSRPGDDVDVLGRFDSAADVTEAVPDWAERCARPNSLDELRRDLTTAIRPDSWPLSTAPDHPPGPEPEHSPGTTETEADHRAEMRQLTRAGSEDLEPSPPAIYGLVIEPDGTTTALYEPVSVEAWSEHIGDGPKDGARVDPRLSEGEYLYLLVDDFGHAKGLPVNPVATALYGTGWPILGTAILCEASDKALPPGICERFPAQVLDAPYHGETKTAEPTTELRAHVDVNVGGEHELGPGLDLS